MKKIILIALFSLLVFSANSRAQIPFWHQTNGPKGGTVRNMAIDSMGRIIIFTSGSGVYRSIDNGMSWELLNRGLPTLNMYNGAAGPTGYVYAYDQPGASAAAGHLFRLDENAANPAWEDITPNLAPVLNYNDIVADADGTVYLGTAERGVLRSDDNGMTWNRKNLGLSDTNKLGKVDSNVVIFLLAVDGRGGLYTATDFGSIAKSTDKGNTWVKYPTKHPKGHNLSTLGIAANGNIVTGNFGTYDVGGNIYVSQDAGVTWNSVYTRPGVDLRNNVEKIILIPGSTDIYANAHGPTLRSQDFGVTWQVMNDEKRGDETFTMAVRRGNLYQMCEPDGIFLSTDNGVNWTPKNDGLLATFMRGMAINSKQKLFGITEYGLWRSSDDGANWDQAPEYGEDYFPSIFINKKDYIYIGTSRGLFRSKNDGDIVERVLINLAPKDTINIINQVGDNGQGKLFCAANDSIGFIYSTDDGDHWTRIHNLQDSNIKSFAFGIKDTILAVGFRTNLLYRSLDQGNSWQTLPDNQNVHGTGQVLIHPDGSFLALVIGREGGIFRSVDAGQSWSKIFPPEEIKNNFKGFFSMMIDLVGSIIVCADSGGIYRSVPGSSQFSQWISVSSGLTANDFPNHFINCSAVVENPVSHIYFAASRGLGVFKSIPNLGVSSGHPSPASAISMTTNPNPFTTATNISFKLKTGGDVSIDVFDLLERKVATIFSGRMEQGEQSLVFDASTLPSGSYAIILHEGGATYSTWVSLTK